MLARLGPWCLPLATAWVLFCTLRAAAWERIQSLGVVESYGFAVYEQLIRNRAFEGVFSQTIHRGYIDHWMWSGHRSVALYVTPWFYRIWPEPLTLSSLQIGLVAAGCFPAFGMGRTLLGGTLGGAVGLVLYACFPPFWVLALSDYQDIVLGIPFALSAVWALRARSPWLFALAGFLCACTREEWAATLPVLGLAAAGGWRQRLRYTSIGLATALLFTALVVWLGRDAVGYQTPVQTHAGALFGHLPPIQRGWPDYHRFYVHFLVPTTGLAVLSPVVALPGAGALLVHLTTPNGSGIDADWRGHIHHMAPVATFFVAASIDGLSHLGAVAFPAGTRTRWQAYLDGRGAVPRWALLLVLATVVGVYAVHTRSWVRMLALSPTANPNLEASRRLRPEWAIVAGVPENAVIATDPDGALFVAGFRRSYTYGESLAEKSRLGLRELDYLLVRRRDTTVLGEAVQLGGTVLAETTQYQLLVMPRAERLGVGFSAPADGGRRKAEGQRLYLE